MKQLAYIRLHIKVFRHHTMRVSLGKRFLLGTLGAPAGVLGSGVDGPRRNQLLIAQIMKILEKTVEVRGKEKKKTVNDGVLE